MDSVTYIAKDFEERKMLNIPASGELDLLSLGALVHRLDPGIIPFRKATEIGRAHV